MKNLIFGYCVGLADKDIRIFCESALTAVKSPTDIVIFAKGEFQCAKESENGSILFIPAASIWQGIKKDRHKIRWASFYFATRILRGLSNFQRRVSTAIFGSHSVGDHSRQSFYLHPALARYIYYSEFLVANAGKYGKVLIADVRDVYFQGDPFEGHAEAGFVTFLEPGGVTCAEERNRRWIRSVFGSGVAAEMAGHGVICSGVSLGCTASMMSYLECMCREILDRPAIPYSDQGIHNVLIRRGSVKATILENQDALTLTAGFDTAGSDYRLEGDRVLSAGGLPFRIVHQFDRHPELESAVGRQFSTKQEHAG